ncbi:AAA-like domain-containing protein [Aureivirga marina]|uniref:AAA-like domain-containing protein n=1 Tax=Aureivirga marina TaxID=1182451 RepID=UPI0018CBE587|nr:AAA-like domain-containing protein [Aureivirga marina]
MIKEKVLKKYTTIPEHLYVKRGADEQLEQIVNDMQRPGYVLVARQMGKTNLLFNAKRTLENENRLFVYVDLSNVFEKEIDCYRNIIDSIIEPNEELFEDIEQEIYKIRDINLPPHKEYSRSLRKILNCFKGDVVIILDEIDALRSAEYSDKIFAQIRSNYFSRTNFSEFERLTYILSGVIEPTELIKDRNKSPFNIGEKIYLNDFNFDEFKNFINKSGLDLTNELINEIFNWTNGNPRLTFDICSEVESYIIDNNKISIENLEQIITKKYLISYDIPPIDHIRELIRSNKAVRDAILKIHQNRQNELSDEIKKKLYLYGVITSDFDEDSKIKNLIIKKSISKEWIDSIDKQNQNSLNYGLDKVDSLDFDEAIKILSDFLDNANPSKNEIEICNYNLGFSYYKIEKYKEAIKYFSKSFLLDPYKNNSKCLLGICKINNNKVDEGIEILKKVIQSKSNDFAYRTAILNYASIISIEKPKYAIELYKDLLNSIDESSDNIKDSDKSQIKTLGYYYISTIYSSLDQKDKSNSNLEKALKYSNLSDSLFLSYLFETINNNNIQVIDISNKIIKNEIKFNQKEEFPYSFNEKNLYKFLDLLINEDNKSYFNDLLEYSIQNLFKNKFTKIEIVFNILSKSETTNHLKLLENLLETENEIDREYLFSIYKNLSFLHTEKDYDFFKYFDEYKNIFKEEKSLDENDIYLFMVAIKKLSDKYKIIEAIDLCSLIEEKFLVSKNSDLEFEFVIIYYWCSSLYFSLKKRRKAIEYANKGILLINNSKKNTTSFIDEEGLKSIYEQMNQIKHSSISQQPIVKSKKYGRNDRIKVKYSNGKIVENKYKKLEADIIAKRCIIID